MDDKHDPNGSVPIGTFQASDDELDIPIEIVVDDEHELHDIHDLHSVDERQLAIQAGPDTQGREHRQILQGQTFGIEEPPRRQRVATLLGVPLPGVAVGKPRGVVEERSDPLKASKREITAAVDDALDERPTTIYGYDRNSLAELESIVEAEMSEVTSHDVHRVSNAPDVTDATGEIIGVVGDSSDTGTFQIEVHDPPRSRKSSVPVLAPAQFVEASARDAKLQPEAKAEAAARELASARDRDRDPQPTAAIASRSERKSQEAARARREGESDPPLNKPKPISSLAPVELKRAPAKPREPTSAIGYALVAAMVLLGIGGWFLTAGGYRRSTDPQPTAAANVLRPSDPLASAKLATMPTEPAVSTTPAPVAEPTPPVEEAAPAPTPTPSSVEPGTGRSRVASKTVRKTLAAPAPVQNGDIETPSRDDVLNGLDRVRSTVRACAEGRNGVAEVDLTIAANGIVTNALVGGDFGGTPQGSCIARAVRRARFPMFKQDRYRVLFPYVL